MSKMVDLELEPCARQYKDVMEKLAESGYRATFTQTGGMCPAIQLEVDGARFALVTDADGPLAWDRADHRGWAVSVYEFEDTSDAVSIETASDSSVDSLMTLLPSAI